MVIYVDGRLFDQNFKSAFIFNAAVEGNHRVEIGPVNEEILDGAWVEGDERRCGREGGRVGGREIKVKLGLKCAL